MNTDQLSRSVSDTAQLHAALDRAAKLFKVSSDPLVLLPMPTRKMLVMFYRAYYAKTKGKQPRTVLVHVHKRLLNR